MSSLVDYTDKAIMKILLDLAQQMNPWLRVGEAMTAPIAVARGGKIIDEDKFNLPPANLVRLKNPSNYVLPPQQAKPHPITAGSVKLRLEDVNAFRTAGLHGLDFSLTKPTYIHPYLVDIPNREWLETYSLGDMVAVEHVDPTTFEVTYVETPLTQQMVDDNSELIFRFALSDQ